MLTVCIIIGSILFFGAWACCIAASDADDQSERMFNEYLRKKNSEDN